MSAISDIPNFKGKQYIRGSKDYETYRYQYGYSSHPDRVHPALIAFPKSVEDVCSAVVHAKDKKLRIAVRTGGHQYSAASSTVGDNIQLDMTKAFHEFEFNRAKKTARVGISFGLNEFNQKLGENHAFLPHGQCSHVHVGGHAQTGGYGQLGRAFGLFGDHIQEIEIVTPAGVAKTLKRSAESEDDRKWFWAFLGGSPGNYGILTHLTLRVHLNDDHKGSRGLKFVVLYDKHVLIDLLKIKAKMAAQTNLVSNLDYCITVLSNTPFSLFSNHGVDEKFKEDHPNEFGHDSLPGWPAGIMVYAQWAHTDGANYERDGKPWLDEIQHVGLHKRDIAEAMIPRLSFFDHSDTKRMSDLTREWIFFNVREFDLPYEKRTYMSNNTNLDENGWVDWVAGRIDYAMQKDKIKLSIQIQHFGGENSKFRTGGAGANPADTSYSWRDSTIMCVMDCFYEEGGHNEALRWQAENDQCVGTPGAIFCDKDRRVLWGSYNKPDEECDLNQYWAFYHEDQKKFDALRDIKRTIDPDGILVPNKFCIGWNMYPDIFSQQVVPAAARENLLTDAEGIDGMSFRAKHVGPGGMDVLLSKHFAEHNVAHRSASVENMCCLIC